MKTKFSTSVSASVCGQDWLNAFAGHVEASGTSARTIQAYCQDVRAFSVWFEGENNGQELLPELVTSIDLRGWRSFSLQIEKVKPSTWNRRWSSLKAFCRWCQAEGFVTYDPFQGVQRASEVENPPRWLSDREYRALLRAVERGVNTALSQAGRVQAVRDAAMVGLMVWAGLREYEVCELDAADVQLGERSGKVIVRLGKGEKYREVPLNNEARRALKAWMELRPEGAALFVGKGGERMGTRGIQRRVAAIGQAAGIEVTPHQLRHTFAKRLVDKGQPLTVVQRLMGHARLETTARYIKPGWGDLENAVEGI